MAGVGYANPFRLRKPRLYELARLGEPAQALSTENVEHRLRCPSLTARVERPLLNGGHLRLEEHVTLTDRVVERVRQDPIEDDAVIIAAHRAEKQVHRRRRVAPR
jgi:hypothetical protein